MRILLAEDDVLLGDGLLRQVQQHGCSAHETAGSLELRGWLAVRCCHLQWTRPCRHPGANLRAGIVRQAHARAVRLTESPGPDIVAAKFMDVARLALSGHARNQERVMASNNPSAFNSRGATKSSIFARDNSQCSETSFTTRSSSCSRIASMKASWWSTAS